MYALPKMHYVTKPSVLLLFVFPFQPWWCLPVPAVGIVFFLGGEPMATGFSCQGNVVVPWRRSCHCPWSGAPFKWGWIVAMCTSCYIVIVHVPWKSSSIWSGPWKIHITSKMYLQKHVISYIDILMLYTIQICTWSGISKKPCRLRFWPWIKANLWSCRDFWRILRLQYSFRSPNNLCFEWQKYKAFHVVCKRCITHMYIYNIPKSMDSLISHAPNYPNKLHTLIPHLWQYQKKHSILTSEVTGTILLIPQAPTKKGTFLERGASLTLKKNASKGMWGMFWNMWEWLNIYIYIYHDTHIYDICCPLEVCTFIFWHILFGCKALIGNLTSPPWDDCIFAYVNGWCWW